MGDDDRGLSVEQEWRRRVEAEIGDRPLAPLSRRAFPKGDRMRRILRGGQRPTLGEAFMIADALGIPPGRLLPVDVPTPAEMRVVEALRSGDGYAVADAVAAMGIELPRDATITRGQLRRVGAAADELARAAARLTEMVGEAVD